jgi:DNA polymerase-1
VIGTVGKICSNNGWECVIVTGDRDSLQLIDENVHVKLVISRPGQTTATLYTEEKFKEEYGFAPKQMVDLKALMGDSSDNIPGVAGVGQKTATDLLLRFGSLDGVYENLNDPTIRPKLREKLENGKESAYLSYELATIVSEAPIDFEPMDAVIQPYNKPELYALFQKLEFIRLIDKYGLRGAEIAAPKAEKKVESLPRVDLIDETASSYAVYVAADGSIGVAWDRGVGALTPMEAQMGISLPVNANYIFHDSKTTMHTLDALGLSYGKVVFDTALAAYDLNPSQSDYPVSKLATNFLGMSVEDGDAVACAEAIWYLRAALSAELDRNGMEKLYYDIELPLWQADYACVCRLQ